jgi:hypothetical protein
LAGQIIDSLQQGANAMEGLGICCLMVAGFPVFFLVWMAAVARFIRPKRYWPWGILSVPALFVVFSCWWAAVSFYETRPSVIFQSAFGFAPTPDVEILNSSRNMVTGKWDMVYLEFNADQPTIDRILQNGFARISAKDIIERYDAPFWWKPSTDEPGTWIYATGTQDPGYRGESRYFFNHDLLIYNRVTRNAYFRYRR